VANLENHSGRMLGEFLLREPLDEGGFGTVYRCEQPLLGREAVVKVMHKRRRNHEIAHQRFLREAHLASRLSHPYAAHIYAFGNEDDGLLWIAMELVHGITLTRWLRERGPLPLEQFVPFFDRVAEVVQVAHESGIVHRDLKPSNVMIIEHAGQLLPKLVDFGVAKLLDTAFSSPAHPDEAPLGEFEATPPSLPSFKRSTTGRRVVPSRLTRTDATIGSPPYMSPEQWTDPVTVGPSADLYALAVVAYEALTGRQPFTTGTIDDYAELHCNAPIPPLGGNFAPEIDRWFQRAMAKRPEDRFASALDLAAALRTALRSHPREQLRLSAQQWDEQARPAGLLPRGEVFSKLEQWSRHAPEGVLSGLERSFLAASKQHVRRSHWARRALVAVAAAAVLAGVQYRAVMQARVAEMGVTQAEAEQGRAALLHDESADAQHHLAQAYRRGDHSLGTTFMLTRALLPQLTERARFTSTSGKMWWAAFSPSGQQIVTTDDQNAQIWDARTHQLLFTLPHGDIVYHAVYSADGAWLVTAGADAAVRIWDATSGALLRTLRPHDEKPRSYFLAAISPDGALVAAMDIMGKAAQVWNARTAAQVADLPNDGSEYSSMEFSADGRWLATNGGDDARVFDTSTWVRALTIAGPNIRTLSFDPTGPRLATGTFGGDAAIWAIPSGERIRHLRELGEPIDRVAFAPNGKLLVTASRDGAEQVWNTGSGALQSQFNHLRVKILSIEFDLASKLVVSAGTSGTVVVSDAALGMPVAMLQGPRNSVRTAHFDPSSHRVVGASWDGTARVWDATSQYRRWGSTPIGDDCETVESLEPDRRFIAFSCRNHGTQVWDTAQDRLLAELPAVSTVDGDYYSAFPAVSVAGDRAAIARGNTVEVYSLPDGKLIRTIAHPAAVNAVAFAVTGNALASGSIDGAVLVTVDAREPIALPLASGGIDAVGFLPDGRVVSTDTRNRLRVYDPTQCAMLADLAAPTRVRLLRPSRDGERLITIPVRAKPAPPVLWDVEHYGIIRVLEGHLGRVFSARFVKGDSDILTAGNDGAARLWDGTTGKLRRTFTSDTRQVFDAALSPDGAMMVTGSGDGLLRFWDLATGRQLWRLQAHRPFVIGIHFEGQDIVTRGFAGDMSRWAIRPIPATVLENLASCLPLRFDEQTQSWVDQPSCTPPGANGGSSQGVTVPL